MSNYVLTPQAVRKLKTALQGKRGTGGAHMNSSANIYESEYPAPFSVQWAQSVGDSGSWIIWLPGSSLVMWGKDALDITEDLDAASGYPSGWYELPSSKLPASGGTLYLLITPPQKEEESGSASESASTSASEGSETGEAEAEFSATAGTDPQISVPICVAATATGTNEKTVKQLVTSAIVLTDDGGAKKTDVPEPDDISVNFAGEGSESESGTDGGGGESSGTDGGEGEGSGSGDDSGETEQAKKLQIKNWDNAQSNDEANNLADLMGTVDGEPHTDNGNYELLARKTDSDEKVLTYLPIGSLKKTVEKVETDSSGATVTITFTYTDGTTTQVVLPKTRDGAPGAKGDPGDTPEITAEKIETTTHIYADGDLIADIEDGHTPNMTAANNNGTVTLYADGVALVSWQEGSGGGGGEEMAWDTVTAITGISFKIESGKLKAVLTKTSFNVPNTFDLHPVAVEPTTEVDVCNVEEVDVVTSETYSTSSHAFTNTRQRVKVLGATSATGQTPFTATPLSGE